MANPEPIASPYGNAPEDLQGPVPSTVPDFTQQISQVRIPTPTDRAHVPQNEAPPPADFSSFGAELDSSLADFGSSLEEALGTSGDSAVPGQDFMVDEPQTFAGVDVNLKQQLADLPVRVQANLAERPEAQFATLQKSLGAENVRRTKDGDIYFRKPGEGKFRKLDPSSFEVINDVFSDFYRESIEGLFGAGGAILGGAAGAAGGTAAAPGVGTVAGAGTGATVGYGLGTALGSTAADAIGELFLGVQRPDISPGVKGAAERTGGALEKGALAGLFKGIADRFLTRREAVKAIKKLGEAPKGEALTEGVKQNLQTLDDLRTLGYTKKIGSTNVEIPTHQLVPHLPKVQGLAASVADEKAFQLAQKQASENIHATALDLVEEAADLSKGKLRQAARTGIPETKAVGVEDISGLFNKVRKAEGALIQEFRNKASAETVKKFALPAPNTQNALKGIFEQLGVKPEVSYQEAKLAFPDDDTLAQVLGTDSRAYISGFKKDLQKVFEQTTRAGGGMKIDDLIGQSNLIGAKNEGARRVGGLYKRMIGQLSSALRADSREQMAKLLDPEDAMAYTNSMKRFQNVAQSMDQLSGFLDDEIGLNTFARGLVNKGKNGLGNLRAAKEFLLQEDPEKYRSVIGEYFEELALKHRDPNRVGGFNAKGMRKDLASLGSEYLDELFPKSVGANKSLVLRTFDLADQVEGAIVKGSDDALLKAGQKIAGGLSAWHRGVNTVWALMHFGDRDNRMLKLLSREGVESFMKDVPKPYRDKMRKTLQTVLEIGRQNGALQTAGAAVRNAPYAAAAGGVQRVIRGGRPSEE